jgi:pyruvate dehydrogenase E1 component alpha subunit
MAELWKLPVIYVIENNKYGMGTSVERGLRRMTDCRSAGIVLRHSRRAGRRHGCSRGDGSLQKAAGMVPLGKGPYILEMVTYRYRGHSMSDPAKYRSKDEVQKCATEHDPIEQVKQAFARQQMGNRRRSQRVDKDIRKIVTAEAAEFAQTDPEPDASELYTDILL